MAPNLKPTFNASELGKYCRSPTMSDIYKLLLKDERFSRLGKIVLKDLKTEYAIYNRKMQQIISKRNETPKQQNQAVNIQNRDSKKIVSEKYYIPQRLRADVTLINELENQNEPTKNGNFKRFNESLESQASFIESVEPKSEFGDSNLSFKCTNLFKIETKNEFPVQLVDFKWLCETNETRESNSLAEINKEDNLETTLDKLNELNEPIKCQEGQMQANKKLIEYQKINDFISSEWDKAFRNGSMHFNDAQTKNNVKKLLKAEQDIVLDQTKAYTYIDKCVHVARGLKLESNILKQTNQSLNRHYVKNTKKKVKDYANFKIMGKIDALDSSNSSVLEIKTKKKSLDFYFPSDAEKLQGMAYMDLHSSSKCLFSICDSNGTLYFSEMAFSQSEFDFLVREKLNDLVNNYLRNLTERGFLSLIIDANQKELLSA